MAGPPFAVTPQIPAQITGVYPIIVSKTGLAYTISFAAGLVGTVTKRQWFEAVATLYDMNTLFAAVNSDANDPAWMQFYGGYGVTNSPSDPLAALTKTTFALTDAQMDALFTLAMTLTP
jgi:hypothetical protein